MLGIHGVGRAGADYYLSDDARELPAPGVGGCWTGAAAARLGLEGAIGPAEFRALFLGTHPRSGRPIGSGRTAVAAFDLTFSAPKSASVLFALGGPDAARRIVAVHDDAVHAALAYLEQHGASAARRAGPERTVIATTGVIAGTFTHGVNRNGDPHLHSHAVMLNLVHGVDGRWSACDSRGISAHREAASAVYEAHLRAGISAEWGVRWTGGPGRRPEIEGIGAALLGEFSSRRADIRRHMHEVGAHSAHGARVAWAVTRPAKGPGTPYGELAREWARRARAVGGRRGLVPGLPGPPEEREAGRRLLDEHRFAGVICLTPHGGARRRDVVTAFSAAAPEGIVAPALARLVDQWVPAEGVGVAEPLRQRREVVPAAHLLRALGARPVDPVDHAVWVGAAAVIDRYRSRWGLERSADPLGLPACPSGLATLPAARLADHLSTTRHLAAARSRLGLGEPFEVERGLAR